MTGSIIDSPGDERQLKDLISVGDASVKDFHLLSIRTVAQLKGQSPQELYDRLCRITGQTHDICVLDLFSAAVAQANDPHLPAEQASWWYWSRKRKALSR